MAVGPYRNTILRHLEPEAIKRLQLRHIMLDFRALIFSPGKLIDQIVFLEEGLGSLTIPFKSGAEVEVSMFGYGSVLGVSALLGAKRSINNTFMQIGGHGFFSPIAVAKAEFDRKGHFHDLALRYLQAQLTQATQNAACNVVHKHEQRLARWLVLAAAQVNRDTLDLSHEFLAIMLGSTRSTVTLAASALKKKGCIDYTRGSIRILNQTKLEKAACECAAIILEQLRELTEPETGFVA